MLKYDISEFTTWLCKQAGGAEIMVKLSAVDLHRLHDIVNGFHDERDMEDDRIERESAARRARLRTDPTEQEESRARLAAIMAAREAGTLTTEQIEQAYELR